MSCQNFIKSFNGSFLLGFNKNEKIKKFFLKNKLKFLIWVEWPKKLLKWLRTDLLLKYLDVSRYVINKIY